MDIKCIVIPDVHGRKFWRKPVDKFINEDVKIIFLGDYLDPYEYEEIEDEYKEFVDIIGLKKKFPDKVVLLLGNHDLHYLTRHCIGSRWSYENAKKYVTTFNDNLDLFDITYTAEIGGKVFYFSHAGVNPVWLNRWAEEFGLIKEGITNYKQLPDFNEMFHSNEKNSDFFLSTGDVSTLRGGTKECGSIVWADWKDHLDKKNRIPGIIQIFGHTQQEKDPVNLDNEMYCLDVRRPFYITVTGEVIDSKTKTEIPVQDSNVLFKELQERRREANKRFMEALKDLYYRQIP